MGLALKRPIDFTTEPPEYLRRPLTYRDYCAWPEGTRAELIDGEVYLMAPAPSRLHQEMVLGLARQIADALESSPCRVYIAPFDVRLPLGDEPDDEVTTVVQPDLSVICRREQLDERGCRGAPQWIIEVLSPSSYQHDLYRKRALYERAGVAEYWTVMLSDPIVFIDTLQDGRYRIPEIVQQLKPTASRTLPQVRIDWERIWRD